MGASMNNVEIKNGSVLLTVNPKIYPLDTIYSAAYVFLDRAYILLDGNPDEIILVQIKPKAAEDLQRLGCEFNNELLNYADYHSRAEHTQKIRELILQRALITNDPSVLEEANNDFNDLLDDLDGDEEMDCFNDPEGIAIPWEEKYGKAAKASPALDQCDAKEGLAVVQDDNTAQ